MTVDIKCPHCGAETEYNLNYAVDYCAKCEKDITYAEMYRNDSKYPLIEKRRILRLNKVAYDLSGNKLRYKIHREWDSRVMTIEAYKHDNAYIDSVVILIDDIPYRVIKHIEIGGNLIHMDLISHPDPEAYNYE